MAQWVKRWATDLAVPSSIPARGRLFSTVNGVPLHTASHRPDMSEILLKRTQNCKPSIHPSDLSDETLNRGPVSLYDRVNSLTRPTELTHSLNI